MKLKCLFLFFSLSAFCLTANAQQDTLKTPEKTGKEKLSLAVFRDSLDGAIDLSNFLIGFHGFIPMVNLITQQALGGIGVMVAPVFIQPNKHAVKGENTPPTITAAFAGYTANNTWGVGAIRVASLPKAHLKYRTGAVYANVNMDFYREIPVVGDKAFNFNIKTSTVFAIVLRQIGKTKLYIGPEYYFMHTDISPQFQSDRFPDFQKKQDFSNHISNLGLNLDLDKRDNVFTPDKGLHLTSDYRVSADWLGSDYNFQNFHVAAYQYIQTTKKLVSGFRLESNIQSGRAPFYMKPAISLRGVPMGRYQGDQTYVAETEQRFDFVFRWSLMAFAGMAKAPTREKTFKESELVYNYGTGFRYLLARKFGLRTGIDIAWSNDDFGWYIIFGSAWNGLG